MKHNVAGRKLSRDNNARQALLNNLTDSLIIHGQVKTTLAKAKFVRSYVEKIITKAKANKLGNNRVIASKISKNAFARLFEEIAPGYTKRDGGYTRIVKLPSRLGDNAPQARLELVEWERSQVTNSQKVKKEKKILKKG